MTAKLFYLGYCNDTGDNAKCWQVQADSLNEAKWILAAVHNITCVLRMVQFRKLKNRTIMGYDSSTPLKPFNQLTQVY